MNKEVMDKWTAALRSGKYVQGVGALHRRGEKKSFFRRDKDKFCCLGVLCDIAVSEGVVHKELQNSVYLYSDRTGALPDEVVKWAGLNSSDPSVAYATSFDGYGRGVPLSEVNDATPSTFDEIADMIEKSL